MSETNKTLATQEIQAKQQAELDSKLWSIANDLRGNMDAAEFKNYMLGIIFYRFLSNKLEKTVNDILKDDEISYAEAWKNESARKSIVEALTDDTGIGYVIEPRYLWSTIVKMIKEDSFTIEYLTNAITALSESTQGKESEHDFANLFDDMDLNSTHLGKTAKDRADLIGKVISKIDALSFDSEEAQIDVFGDAYEYLISQFASSAGKKAGEFYTPQQVSKLLAKLVTYGKTKLRNVYDPTCGSGSLLLRVGDEVGGSDNIGKYYGQEKISTTYNLARMNLFLHGVRFKKFDLENNDTLENPCPRHDMKFEAVVANPPYSAKWSADPKFLNDPRFSGYGRLAPKSKADYAFVLHMLYHLADDGVMAVVLPHGVLFRGAAEGEIRKTIVKDRNYLDAVIGLPANLFFGTSIPTCVLVFKKCKKDHSVLFIDASKEFEPGKNQNRLTDANIQKIMDTYVARKDVEKYAHLADMEEIEKNDFNLNIPRYVDTFEEEEPIDIQEVLADLRKLKVERDALDAKIEGYLKELGLIKEDGTDGK